MASAVPMEENVINTILNLIGWMPVYALLITGVYAYIKVITSYFTRR